MVKERTDIPGYVEKVERFSTWWSNNIATVVVYYDSYYRVFLLVYDLVYSTYKPAKFPVDNDCNYWGRKSRGKHSSLSDAEKEAYWLRDGLIWSISEYNKNPILLIHPYSDCSRSFNTFVTSPYVVKKYSTSSLKPLDIVKTDMGQFHHVGVYLGKIDEEFKVCHFTKDKNNTTIDKWSDFLEGKVEAYHPVIPFKSYWYMSKHIVWAKDNSFRRGNYDLTNRNCEHFANMIVYRINYSEQIEKNKLAIFNNNKTSICLQDEIRDTNILLSKKTDWETKKYETKYLQEIPPKEYCRIM